MVIVFLTIDNCSLMLLSLCMWKLLYGYIMFQLLILVNIGSLKIQILWIISYPKSWKIDLKPYYPKTKAGIRSDVFNFWTYVNVFWMDVQNLFPKNISVGTNEFSLNKCKFYDCIIVLFFLNECKFWMYWTVYHACVLHYMCMNLNIKWLWAMLFFKDFKFNFDEILLKMFKWSIC